VAARFWPAVAPERRLLLASTFALFLEVGLQLLEPWPLKIVFDHVLGTAMPPAWLGTLSARSLVLVCAIALFVLIALRAGTSWASTIGFALAGNRALTRVREDLFTHVQRLSFGGDRSARLGDWLTRIVGDVGILKEVVVTALLPLGANGLILVGMLAVMAWMDPILALLAMAPLPLLALFTVRRTRSLHAVGREQRQREGELANAAAESLGALAVVQALSLESRFEERFRAASQRDLTQGVRGKRLAAGLERGVDLMIGVSTALVLGLGALRALSGHVTPGELIVFLTYQRRAFRPARNFAKYTARIAKATASGERVLELLERAPAVRERPDARPAPPLHGAIAFRDVRFAYPEGETVLDGFDLEIAAGESVALVGASGAGKSTLAALLLRLADPQRGAVLVDGRDLREFTLPSLRRQIALVPQEDLLFAGTLRDNIACACPDADADRIAEAARIARVDEFAARLPDGLETWVGERGATLSRGQRQRLCIARAALRNTPILLLDEPMTGLDEQNEQLVRDALERVARGRTCVIVTHDPVHAARCHRIVTIANGRAVEVPPLPLAETEPGVGREREHASRCEAHAG
jgi:ATP-binding cassette subfamily B protein